MSNQRRCDNCHNPYTYKRSTSRFCSPACRVDYARTGNYIDKQFVDLKWAYKNILKACQDKPMYLKDEDVLQRMSDMLTLHNQTDSELFSLAHKLGNDLYK